MSENVTPQQPTNQGSGMGVAALVLGLVGLIFGWVVPFLWLTSVLAIIFGIIGMKRQAGKGMAIAGMVLGIIAVVIYLLVFGLVMAIIASFS